MPQPDFAWRDAPTPDDARERQLRAALAELEREYRTRAKPIVDELVRIQSMRAPRFLLPTGGIDLDALKAAGLNTDAVSEQLLTAHRAIQAALVPPPGESGGG